MPFRAAPELYLKKKKEQTGSCVPSRWIQSPDVTFNRTRTKLSRFTCKWTCSIHCRNFRRYPRNPMYAMTSDCTLCQLKTSPSTNVYFKPTRSNVEYEQPQPVYDLLATSYHYYPDPPARNRCTVHTARPGTFDLSRRGPAEFRQRESCTNVIWNLRHLLGGLRGLRAIPTG